MVSLKELEIFFGKIPSLNFNTEKEAWNYVVDYIHSATNSQASTFFSVDEEKKFLTFSFVLGPNSEELEGISFSYTGAAGWCALNKKPLLVRDVEKNPLFSSKVDYATKFKTRSIMIFPCFCQNELVGIAEFINPQGKDCFDEEDFSFAFSCISFFSKIVYSLRLEFTIKKLSLKTDSAINNLSGGFVAVDNHKKIVFFNPKAYEILDVKGSQIGIDIDTAFLPDEIKEAIKKTLLDKIQVKRAEFFYEKNGARKRIGYSTLNLKTVDGSIDGAGVIFQDITRF